MYRWLPLNSKKSHQVKSLWILKERIQFNTWETWMNSIGLRISQQFRLSTFWLNGRYLYLSLTIIYWRQCSKVQIQRWNSCFRPTSCAFAWNGWFWTNSSFLLPGEKVFLALSAGPNLLFGPHVRLLIYWPRLPKQTMTDYFLKGFTNGQTKEQNIYNLYELFVNTLRVILKKSTPGFFRACAALQARWYWSWNDVCHRWSECLWCQ